MPAHYGIALISDAHKNAINAIMALIQGENPALSENLSQPANASGSPNDAVEYWFGGRPFSDAELLVFQDLPNNLPLTSWPVAGVSGQVTQQQAEDAAAAFVFTVTTQDTYSTQQAQQTLASALGAKGVQRVVFEE